MNLQTISVVKVTKSVSSYMTVGSCVVESNLVTNLAKFLVISLKFKVYPFFPQLHPGKLIKRTCKKVVKWHICLLWNLLLRQAYSPYWIEPTHLNLIPITSMLQSHLIWWNICILISSPEEFQLSVLSQLNCAPPSTSRNIRHDLSHQHIVVQLVKTC